MSRLVIADSSCDMRTKPGELEIVPLTIMLGVDQYVDDENLHLETMLNQLREYKGPSSTACPSVQAWMNAYLKADECFVVTMTSALSGTYNSARVASEMCLQEFPEKKIALFDSLSTGEEMELLVEKLNEWIADNKPFEEIERLGADYLASTHLLFMLKSLHNLASNGRVSKLIASAFDVLGMRMVAMASPEGTIKPIAQCRGDRRAFEKMMSSLQSMGFNGGRIRIGNVLNDDGAQKFKDMVLAKWPGSDVKVYPSTGLCSYYAERGGLMIGFETSAH